MGRNEPLNQHEREQIYLGRQQGKTIVAIAQEMGRSPETVRKWWRRFREYGLPGLTARRRGRKRQGALASFSPELKAEAMRLKRTHSGWGPLRVLVELRRDPRWCDQPLPGRSRLAVLFKSDCPECLVKHNPRPKCPTPPPKATAPHEVWQLDNQEQIRLLDGEVATICSIRDPWGAAMLASRAFAVRHGKSWRKLTWMEVRQVLREAFTEWQTLPDSVWTDNEHALVGNSNDPFPSRLTLWLVGLGIHHGFIRPNRPTDQPHIERNHRTLDLLAIDAAGRTDLLALQQALDRERWVYNHCYPCHASDCQGHPPLEAHPALCQPRRPYRPEWEWRLFSPQQVYTFLSELPPLERKVNCVGETGVGGIRYSIGIHNAGQTVWVTFDANRVEWVFSVRRMAGDPSQDEPLARRSPKGLDRQSLTGLDQPVESPQSPPIQLTLPCLVP